MPKDDNQLIALERTIQDAATATFIGRVGDLECLLGDMDGAVKTLQYVVYGLGEGEEAPREVVHYLSDMLTEHMREMTSAISAVNAAIAGRHLSA